MSRLLISGFTTVASTFITSTAIFGVHGSAGGTVGKAMVDIEKLVVACGGTTVEANTSGGLKFCYGESSDVLPSTLVIPTPIDGWLSSDAKPERGTMPMSVVLNELGIRCKSFKVITKEDAHGGWSVSVYEK